MRRRRRKPKVERDEFGISEDLKSSFVDLWSELDRCPNRSETAQRLGLSPVVVKRIYEILVGHAQVLKHDSVLNKLSIDTDFLRRVYLCSLAGMAHKEAAGVLGMSRMAFDDMLRDYPVVRDTWDTAKDHEVQKLIQSLRKRAHGFSQKATYIANYQGDIITKDYKKRYPPDVTAINTLLLNLKKQWQLPNGVGTQADDADRGRIIEHLNRIVEEGAEKHGSE